MYESFTGTMPHAKMSYPPAPVGNEHPYKNKDNHRKLLEYLSCRLQQGKKHRDGEKGRYAQIDKDIACWIRLSEEDKERMTKQIETGVPQATLMNLPITYIHLDDMMTYLMQTFCPTSGMFYHKGKSDEQTTANQVVGLMNNHAIYADYYTEFYQTMWSMLKYNLGGIHTAWETDKAPKIARDTIGALAIEDEDVWSGNRTQALDMYNTFMDPTVKPRNLYKDGEWGAFAYMISHFKLAKAAMAGVYYNVGDLLDNDQGYASCKYYVNPPSESQMNLDGSTASNWIDKLSDNGELSNQGFELVRMYCWLNPMEFGLLPASDKNKRNRYELWRFTICNGERIIDATHQNNAHSHIPMYFSQVNLDSSGKKTKSTGEYIMPLQTFASHLMNIHIQATRKKLFGITVYDPAMVDLSELKPGEVAAFVPAKAEARGKPLSDAIHTFTSDVDTERTMQDLGIVMELLNQFYPTQAMPNQIAGIDRAVTNQVAAVQQGTNRRQQKMALVIDAGAFRPMRFGMYYNILQYQNDQVAITDYRGRTITIDLSQAKMTDLPFILGLGLISIDRMATADKLQMVIFALIQNPNAAAQVDLLGMIDYWSNLLDMDIDMTQFRLAPTTPEAAAPVGAEPPAEGAEAGIQPATDPMAMTGPIY